MPIGLVLKNHYSVGLLLIHCSKIFFLSATIPLKGHGEGERRGEANENGEALREQLVLEDHVSSENKQMAT